MPEPTGFIYFIHDEAFLPADLDVDRQEPADYPGSPARHHRSKGIYFTRRIYCFHVRFAPPSLCFGLTAP